MFIFLFGWTLFTVAFLVIWAVRIDIIYKFQTQAISQCGDNNNDDIMTSYANAPESVDNEDISTALAERRRRRWAKYDSVSYHKLMWDLSKWKYEDFYPKGFFELEE